MHYVQLISDRPLIWGLFIAYVLVTAGLAWLGHKKTGDIKSFAIGSGRMHPAIVGVTLAASIASTATFVINPGFVYVHGVSALMHLGVAAGVGVIGGLLLMSGGFRRVGVKVGAITLPGWLGERFKSRPLRVMFAAINLLSLSFVVLIVGGLSIVMQHTLGLNNTESLVVIIGVVFSYVLIGGATAHAYTNTLQGIIMSVVAVVIVASGLPTLSGAGAKLAAIDPNLTKLVNPASPLFGDFFSVWVCGVVIGFALVCQPHIMTKALYVESDRDLRRSLAVTVVVSVVFSALLLVGLYARLIDLPAAAFIDPATGVFRQDRVMTAYLATQFGPELLAVITIALLAAGMSTLDGLLVALSSIAGHDLVAGGFGNFMKGMDEERRSKLAHRASQLILVGLGATAFIIARNPPELLGIFGQIGVYGIVAASAVPMVLGIFVDSADAKLAMTCSLVALFLHFALYGAARWLVATGGAVPFGLLNPATTATLGILASGVVAAVAMAVRGRSQLPNRVAQPLH
jgi:SSS family solute:Na+ symporter/sodium/pantothenate symporter